MNSVFRTIPKHSLTPASVRKINSTPDKSAQVCIKCYKEILHSEDAHALKQVASPPGVNTSFLEVFRSGLGGTEQSDLVGCIPTHGSGED